MAPSILQETGVSVRDVEAELHTLASPKKSAARNFAIVLGSLLLFVLLGAVSAGPLGILVIVVVLLVHELGHLAAMKVLGYRDVQMFFCTILFHRTPMLRALSVAGAGAVLALITIVTRDVLLGIIAVFTFASVRPAYSSGRLAAQIKQELAEQWGAVADARDRVPSQYLERLVPLLEQRLPDQMCTPARIAAAVRNIWNMVWFRPPSVLASVGLLLLYLACLVTGIVATIGAEVSFQHMAPQS